MAAGIEERVIIAKLSGSKILFDATLYDHENTGVHLKLRYCVDYSDSNGKYDVKCLDYSNWRTTIWSATEAINTLLSGKITSRVGAITLGILGIVDDD